MKLNEPVLDLKTQNIMICAVLNSLIGLEVMDDGMNLKKPQPFFHYEISLDFANRVRNDFQTLEIQP